jgi:TonB family protein
MKTLTLLFLATLLFANLFYSSQESVELKEAGTLTDSVIKLFNQGKYDEALPLANRVLQIREKLLPRNDPQISSALNNLGEIYTAKKNYKAAIQVYLRVLRSHEEVFGQEDVNLTFTLDRLAVLNYAAGNFKETEAAYKRMQALREKAHGANSTQVAESLYTLGEFYRARRELALALDSYKRSLNLYGKVTGVRTADFERVSDGLRCLSYNHGKSELFQALAEIRNQFEPPGAANNGAVNKPELTVLNGKALKLPKPDYPDAAAQRRLSGMVVVKVEIDETGTVIGANDMCQGPPFLSESAVAAAMKARFSPTMLDGRPIKVPGVILYNFTARFR